MVSLLLFGFSRTPTLYKIVSQCTRSKKEGRKKREQRGVVNVLSKMAFIRNERLNMLPLINGLRMKLNGLTSRTINKLNQGYDSVSYATIGRRQKTMAENMTDRMAGWQDITGMISVLDNLDITVNKRHEMNNVSTYDFHLTNNVLIKPRIQVSHLSDLRPVVKSDDVDYGIFLLDEDEHVSLMTNMEAHVRAAWRNLQGVAKVIRPSSHTANKYEIQMLQKTELVGGCLLFH